MSCIDVIQCCIGAINSFIGAVHMLYGVLNLLLVYHTHLYRYCSCALQSVNSCAAVSIVLPSGPGAVSGRILLRHLGHHMEIHTSVKNPSRSLFSTLH